MDIEITKLNLDDGTVVNESNSMDIIDQNFTNVQNTLKDLSVPSRTSQLLNDSDFVTSTELSDTTLSKIDEFNANFKNIGSGLIWQEEVATYSAIATTYPNPKVSWAVKTKDDGYTYRYNGIEWQLIDSNLHEGETVFLTSEKPSSDGVWFDLSDTTSSVEENSVAKEVISYVDTHKVDKVDGKGLSTNDYDNTEKAEVAKVKNKVDKVTGKGLSTNDYTDSEKSQVATNTINIATHTSQIASLASGAPKAVSLVSQMTDTTKNYVYIGSEGGYTAGNWYYYNGSAWVSGGVYQSTGISDGTVKIKSLDFSNLIVGDTNSPEINIFDPAKATNGGYVRTDNGTTITVNAQFSYSDFMDVIEGETLSFSDNQPLAWILLYDSSYNYVSSIAGVVSGGIPSNAVIPTGVSKMRFNFDNTRFNANAYQVIAKRSFKMNDLRVGTNNLDDDSVTYGKLDNAMEKTIKYTTKIIPLVSNPSGVTKTSTTFNITIANSFGIILYNLNHSIAVANYTLANAGDCLIFARSVDVTVAHNSSSPIPLEVVPYTSLLNTDIVVAWKDSNYVRSIIDTSLNKVQLDTNTTELNANKYVIQTIPLVHNPAGITKTATQFNITISGSFLLCTYNVYHALAVANYTLTNSGDYLILNRSVDKTVTHNTSSPVSLQVVNYTELLSTDIVVAWKGTNGITSIVDEVLNQAKLDKPTSIVAPVVVPLLQCIPGNPSTITVDSATATFTVDTANNALFMVNGKYIGLSTQTFTLAHAEALIIDRTKFPITSNQTNVNLQKIYYTALLNTDVVIAWKDYSGLHTIFDATLYKKEIDAKITELESSSGTKIYTPVDSLRKQLNDVYYKLMNGENVNILGIGDSITNFQNSGQLSIADQKTAPVGLAGENWLRRLWKLINYNVWNDKRDTIVNVNGNMGFKRFDHADFTFSNGYSGTTTLGTCDWGTNRNDSEAWRDNDFNGSLGTTPDRQLTTEACYNIPMVGTQISGATTTVSIPSNAIGCRLILGKPKITGGSTSATISISDGQNQTVNPSTFVTYQNYFDFTLVAGTSKTLTLTNNANGELWIWGIEYWTGNHVRVMNFGLAGNTSQQILNKWDYIPKNNIDLVIIETPVLNDCNAFTYTDGLAHGNALFDVIKALNVPILPILVHRTLVNGSMTYDRSTATIGTRYFVPNYVKNYKSILAKNNLSYIDMWSKSINDVGGSLANSVTFPAGYFADWGHPGVTLNQSYEDELKKVFLWNDVN